MLRIFPDVYVLQHAYPAAYAVEFLPVQTMPLTWCLRQVFFRPCALLATVSLVLHGPHVQWCATFCAGAAASV